MLTLMHQYEVLWRQSPLFLGGVGALPPSFASLRFFLFLFRRFLFWFGCFGLVFGVFVLSMFS